jgi:hypothetical protein
LAEDHLAAGSWTEEPLSGDADLAGLAEVTPIKLTSPASQGIGADQAKKTTPETPAKKQYCFIATAAYGSPFVQEVVLLQIFRDRHLCGNPLGEKFIRAYNRFSPYLAGLIRQNEVLKVLTRYLLAPVILLIKKIPSDPRST